MSTVHQRLKQAIRAPTTVGWFVLGCLAANIAISYPGRLNWDSREQYQQAVSGIFIDWHPPIMAWVWSYLRLVHDGSGPLFIAHVGLYWLGFGLLAFTLARLEHVRASWCVLLLSLLPPLLTMNPAILKDVSMAVAFLAAYAVTFFYRSQNKKLPLAGGLFIAILLLYGTLVRANAIFAVPPLVVYAFWPYLFRRPIRLLIVFGALLGLSFPVSAVVNYKLLRAEHSHPFRSLLVYDLTGIAYFSGDVSVFWRGATFSVEEVRRCYSPVEWDTLGIYGKCKEFWDSPSPQQTRTWLFAIAKHPVAYLEHRLAQFNSSLHFIVPWHHTDPSVLKHLLTDVPITRSEGGLDTRVADYLTTDSNPAFTPIFALLLGIRMLPLLFRAGLKEVQPLVTAALALDLSAVFYAGAYFIVGVASQLRYYYWALMAIGMVTILYCILMRRLFVPLNRAGWAHLMYIAACFCGILFAHWMCGDAVG